MTLLFAALLACSGGSTTTETATETDPTTPTQTETSETCGPPGSTVAEVLTLTTRDGVALAADRYAGAPGCPGIVLLHMIPPNNTRADWPANFISKLTENGWSVLALDRRGAGGSAGEPEDSYTGEKGAYDAEVAVQALTEIGAEGMVLIGASNGTTTALDYAIWAPTEGLPEAVALGFMTGGSYTENQNAMANAPDIPAFFTFSDSEAAWSLDQAELGRDNWAFLEYAGGAHGTLMFDAKPKVKTDIVDFLIEVLAPES
jgi:pimeloyl-ACP methyl ester carboxylesterase